jgi:hypothetical protein
MHPTEGKPGHEYIKFADITQLTTPLGLDRHLHNTYRNLNLKGRENLSLSNEWKEVIRID